MGRFLDRTQGISCKQTWFKRAQPTPGSEVALWRLRCGCTWSTRGEKATISCTDSIVKRNIFFDRPKGLPECSNQAPGSTSVLLAVNMESYQCGQVTESLLQPLPRTRVNSASHRDTEVL